MTLRGLSAAALVLAATCAGAQIVDGGGAPSPAAPPTRADVEALLSALEEAYRGEDLEAVASRHGDELRTPVRAAVGGLFESRNYFHLDHRVLGSTVRPDGVLEVDVVSVLRSRRADEKWDRREKTRWIYGIRGGPEGATIVDSRPAPPPSVTDDETWEPLAYRGHVTLAPGPGQDGRAEVVLATTIRREGEAPGREVAFALHPHATSVSAASDGQAVQLLREEGAVDLWRATLPSDAGPGSTVELELTYAFDEVGARPEAMIGSHGVQLLTPSAWHPVFRPARADDLVRATHDVRVTAPDGLVVTMPGRRASDDVTAGGLRTSHWVSEHPGGELAIVGGRYEVTRHDIGRDSVLELYRAPGTAAPSRGVEYVATMVARLEALLGDSPTRRFALIEREGVTMHVAPGLWVMPILEDPRPLFRKRRAAQPFYVLAHEVAHAWLVDAFRVTGRGSGGVIEGLCDALASEWAGEVVSAKLPVEYRGEAIDAGGASTEMDEPLVPAPLAPPTRHPWPAGKAMVAFDMYRALAGREHWEGVLAAWWKDASGRQGAPVAIDTLLERMAEGDPVRAAFVETWFRRSGFAELRVGEVVTRALTPSEAAATGLDPGAWQRAEITIVNSGIGPAPVRVDVEVDGRLERRDLVMGSEQVVVPLDVAKPPRSVSIDPERVVWQGSEEDDTWPPRDNRRRKELGNVRLDRGGRPLPPSGAR